VRSGCRCGRLQLELGFELGFVRARSDDRHSANNSLDIRTVDVYFDGAKHNNDDGRWARQG
jgi:hypothetical protein